MKLNRTGSNWNRLERNKINENWDIIEGSYNDVVGQITDEVVGHLIDSAKLIWKEPVDTVEDLPASAEVGETRMVREADPDGISYVYRYDGENWEKIQEIDVTLVNEVDKRLTRQLAEETQQRFYSSLSSHKEPAFMVSIVDDDGKIGFYTDYLPLIREYNIPVTSAMITSRIGAPNYMTEAQLRECHEAGAEIMSHTHWHDINKQPRDMSEKELFDDFTTTKKIMRELGFNYRGLVQPFGTYTDKVINVARQVFDYNIGTANKGNNIITPPFSNFELLRRTGERHSFEQIKVDIDRARDANGWIILTTHVDQGYGWTEEKTRQIIEYVHSQGGKFVTTLEGFNTHGNLMEVGNSIIAADNNFYGDDFSFLGINAINSNTRPDDPLIYGRKTVTNITSENSTGFPENLPGQLVTYGYMLLNASQEYRVLESFRKFKRVWLRTQERWSAWVLVDQEVSGINTDLDSNQFNATTTRWDFPNGVTYSKILSGNTEGTPRGNSGLLTTYIFEGGNIRHHYQEFQEYTNGSVFRRQGTGTTESGWDAWKTIFEGG